LIQEAPFMEIRNKSYQHHPEEKNREYRRRHEDRRGKKNSKATTTAGPSDWLGEEETAGPG